MHYHRCDHCGTVWKHSDDCKGDLKAHQCPECGEPEQTAQYLPSEAEIATARMYTGEEVG